MLPQVNRDTILEFILDLFAEQGAREYMGEAVSMSQHMEQSAACAAADDAPQSLVVAALLHDIGHFIGGHPIEALEQGNDNLHEEMGARFLEPYFPPSVTEPIRQHVAAKRYLCAVDREYFDCLSPASVQSLAVQGGPMSDAEVEDFESNPWHQDAVRLRRYDDDGKVRGLTIRPVTDYRAAMNSLLQS